MKRLIKTSLVLILGSALFVGCSNINKSLDDITTIVKQIDSDVVVTTEKIDNGKSLPTIYANTYDFKENNSNIKQLMVSLDKQKDGNSVIVTLDGTEFDDFTFLSWLDDIFDIIAANINDKSWYISKNIESLNKAFEDAKNNTNVKTTGIESGSSDIVIQMEDGIRTTEYIINRNLTTQETQIYILINFEN